MLVLYMFVLTRNEYCLHYNSALDVDTTGIQRAASVPLSRDDALAKRLRTLRNQRDQQAEEPKAPHDDVGTEQDPPPPYTAKETPPQQAPSKPPLPPPLPPPALATPTTAARTGHDHYLPVDTDDKTLDEILDSLVIEDDHWSVSSPDSEDEAEEAESAKQVEELLAKLRNDPDAANNLLPSPPGKKPGGDDDDQQNKDDENDDNDENDDDDDSEGDAMSKKVDQILSRTLDELTLDPAPLSTTGENQGDDTTITTSYPDPEISLPTVPQDTSTDTTTTDTNLPDLPTTPQTLQEEDPSNPTNLTLPTVPTALHDPAPPETSSSTTTFEASIANRLAALKGPGHKPLPTDALGLPSAPTSQPEDVPGGLLRPRSGYTDADQRTWCVVCLEDGTIRCLDCEEGGEVYCARCWREMHVGPAAGYDERGHQWVKFDPRVLRR